MIVLNKLIAGSHAEAGKLEAENIMVETKTSSSKNLVILGVLLQTLHVLFGFTAIIGMFINHMLIDQTKGTIYYSQLRWQLITFWVAAALYACAFIAWQHYGVLWPSIAVLLFSFYRIGVCAYHCITHQAIERFI